MVAFVYRIVKAKLKKNEEKYLKLAETLLYYTFIPIYI